MSLSDKELIHYSRQIIMPEIDDSGQLKIKSSKVAIIGLGGLGSSCALYLAAAGIGEMLLVDGDRVESSNLQRQIAHSFDYIGVAKVESAKNQINSINPLTIINTVSENISDDNSQLLKDHEIDVIIDCSDNYPTRYLLNKYSLSKKIPLIHASAIKFQGHITTFNLTENSPCYECLFENNNHNDENCESQGVFPPIVGVIGSMQASEVLKVILGLNALDGYYQTFDLLNNKINTFKLSKNPSCPSCSS
ncbi:HesA/MoeB/ThiF family protein [Kangiella sp. HZ709]|uniref:HesA/MoeB/ThiF family protein n=1 Tax=Kangiella sp. HZ709 TaxID=2666328 RepID=UPI0012AF8E71|nr:HesA/MoeB/ThiF family protein [Kangiella sp. HZ709]MRX26822.1 molybdopterin-synthase adenylyltransferase MoeB [Kangiella sp. HZ709]